MAETIMRWFTPSDSDKSGMVTSTPAPARPTDTKEKRRRPTRTILTSPQGLKDDELTTLKTILGSQ